jgi:ABC-2 type transport system permease protein
MGAGVWMFVLGVLFPLFRLPDFGSLPALITLVAAFTLALTGLGILVSILVPNQLRATEILMIVATPAFIISGYSWPTSQMPVLLQNVAQAIPLTHYLAALRNVFFLKAPLSVILPQVQTLFIYGGVTLLLAWLALWWKMRQSNAAAAAAVAA